MLRRNVLRLFCCDEMSSTYFVAPKCRKSQNVDVKHKSQLRVNINFFSYNVAVVMLIFMKQASVFWLLTGLATVSRLNVARYRQSRLKKCQPVPSLLSFHHRITKLVFERTDLFSIGCSNVFSYKFFMNLCTLFR